MAVTKNCSAQSNMSTSFQHIAVFACGQWSSCKALNRQTDETNSHKDGEWNIDIDLVPKKPRTSRQQSQQKLGFSQFSGKASRLAASCHQQFPLPTEVPLEKGKKCLGASVGSGEGNRWRKLSETKEVLGSLLKVSHQTGMMPDVARD